MRISCRRFHLKPSQKLMAKAAVLGHRSTIPPQHFLGTISDRFQIDIADFVFNCVVDKKTDPYRVRLIFFSDGKRIYNPTLRYAMKDLARIVDDVTTFFSQHFDYAFDAVAEQRGVRPDPQYHKQVLVKPRGDFRDPTKITLYGFVVFVEGAFSAAAEVESAIAEMNHFYMRKIAPQLGKPT